MTVERVMRRLLDRRGLPFLAFSVVHAASDKPVHNHEDSQVLASAEVRSVRKQCIIEDYYIPLFKKAKSIKRNQRCVLVCLWG